MPSAANPTTTTLQNEFQHRSQWKAGVMGMLNVLTVVLAVRLTLLVAVCGAISLAYLAISASDPMKLGALGIYAAVVVVPLIWLASRR